MRFLIWNADLLFEVFFKLKTNSVAVSTFFGYKIIRMPNLASFDPTYDVRIEWSTLKKQLC